MWRPQGPPHPVMCRCTFIARLARTVTPRYDQPSCSSIQHFCLFRPISTFRAYPSCTRPSTACFTAWGKHMRFASSWMAWAFRVVHHPPHLRTRGHYISSRLWAPVRKCWCYVLQYSPRLQGHQRTSQNGRNQAKGIEGHSHPAGLGPVPN
ncbi:hypothetical protein GQ53DRAFT_76092 [Thozetella sp. PMI_491]|nr:hypothetical protein GQ53DRAFT_76092 [Thozetella sp. PMI_491]